MGVVVLSYNRPRWLAEALSSIQGASQVVIVDDGSDFNPADTAAAVGVDATVIQNPPLPVDKRLSTPRTGHLVNQGLAQIDQPAVTYLCDDDVFAPEWVTIAGAAFDQQPDHMVRGEWNILGTQRSAFRGGDGWVLTTGNFAHRMSCVVDEGCAWDESTVAVHDASFLGTYLAHHGLAHGGQGVPCVGMAGWRRDHPFNLLHVVNGDRFNSAAGDLLQRQWLEVEPDESSTTGFRSVPIQTLAQIETLRRIRNLCADGFTHDRGRISRQQQTQWWQSTIKRGWLYFDDPGFVGYGLLRRTDEGRWWNSLAVVPGMRGQGYGTRITADLLSKHDGPQYTQVRAGNIAAVRMHKGWQEIDRQDDLITLMGEPA